MEGPAFLRDTCFLKQNACSNTNEAHYPLDEMTHPLMAHGVQSLGEATEDIPNLDIFFETSLHLVDNELHTPSTMSMDENSDADASSQEFALKSTPTTPLLTESDTDSTSALADDDAPDANTLDVTHGSNATSHPTVNVFVLNAETIARCRDYTRMPIHTWPIQIDKLNRPISVIPPIVTTPVVHLRKEARGAAKRRINCIWRMFEPTTGKVQKCRKPACCSFEGYKKLLYCTSHAPPMCDKVFPPQGES